MLPQIVGAAGLLVIIMGITMLLVVVVSRNKQNAIELEKKALEEKFASTLAQSKYEIQEATYQSIGRELHDNIGQLLSSTKVLLNVASLQLNTTPQALLDAEATLNDGIQEVRNLSKILNKKWLEQFSLLDNLQIEINRLKQAHPIYLHTDNIAELSFSPEKQLILFRLIQEALNNAIRHAEAKKIDIEISQNSHQCFFRIKDDGKGFDLEQQENGVKGVGLLHIRERINLLQGSVEWLPNIPTGTLVLFTIPKEI